MKIREATKQDLTAILAIQEQNPAASHWNRDDYEHMHEDSNTLLLVAELRDDECKDDAVRRPGESRVAGFGAFQCVLDEAELRNLAVNPRCQRQGVGRALMDEAHKRLSELGVKQVYLEVRASNRHALALYYSLGYTLLSKRPEYYHNPREDALIFSYALRERNH